MKLSLMKFSIPTVILTLFLSFGCNQNSDASNNRKSIISAGDKSINYIELSAKLLEQIKKGEPTEAIQKKLAEVNPDILANQLINDTEKEVFWINFYNANIQIILSKHPELYKDRGEFFKKRQVQIAGNTVSFDKIEHGIIRSSKIKLSFGLLRDPFADSFEKKFRTKKTDPRVHFALNCGAKSCPLIAIYHLKNFENKIDAVAKSFVKKTSSYNATEDKVSIIPLFSWFRGDFGGKSGIRKFLKNYGIIPENSEAEIEFTDYDWTLSLGHYYDK